MVHTGSEGKYFTGTCISFIDATFFRFSISAKEGAQTTLHCALDDSIVKDSGAYFDNCREKIPNKMALDEELCEQIWNLTLDSVREYTQLAAD